MSRTLGEWVENIFVLEVEAGESIGPTIKRAISLSSSLESPVMFDFNDREILVDRFSDFQETYDAYYSVQD